MERHCIKFDAKARAFKIDNKVLSSITMVVDVERGEAGWIRFSDNALPQFELVPIEQLTNGAAYPTMPKDVGSDGKPAWLQVSGQDQRPAGRRWSDRA